jgi:hypothetical protein
MRSPRVRDWRDFRNAGGMAAHRPNPAALRAEARLLTIAGFFLLGLGFPLTLIMTAIALGAGDNSPFVPAAVGAPPIMLGYLACHFASLRMVKAKAIESERGSSSRAR